MPLVLSAAIQTCQQPAGFLLVKPLSHTVPLARPHRSCPACRVLVTGRSRLSRPAGAAALTAGGFVRHGQQPAELRQGQQDRVPEDPQKARQAHVGRRLCVWGCGVTAGLWGWAVLLPGVAPRLHSVMVLVLNAVQDLNCIRTPRDKGFQCAICYTCTQQPQS